MKTNRWFSILLILILALLPTLGLAQGTVVNTGTKTFPNGMKNVPLQLDANGKLLVSGAGGGGGGGGDASAANQVTQTTKLTSIDGKLPGFGSAGSPSANAATVQGVSGGTAIPVTVIDASASGTITTQNLVPAGTATASSAVELTTSNGYDSARIQVTGTYTGALSLQGTVDGTTWVTVGGTPFLNENTAGYLSTITSALQSVFRINLGGYTKVRVTGLAAMTGTATVTIRASWGTATVSVDTALPAGTNIVGALVANQSVNVAQLAGTAPVTAGVAGTQAVGGNVAISSAATTNPAMVGGRVTTTLDTSLVNGDVAGVNFSDAGQTIIKDFGSSGNDWSYAAATTGILNTTTAVTVKAAGAASIRNYVTAVQIQAEALGAATEFAIRDGAAGTVLWRFKIGASGCPLTNIVFPSPLRGTAATLLEVVTLTASTTGAVYVNLQGYQSF